MDHFAGIDVSLEQSSVCVVDATGQIVREAKVASEPEALITFLTGSICRWCASAWKPGLCRSGSRPLWSKPGSRRCCWRPGT